MLLLVANVRLANGPTVFYKAVHNLPMAQPQPCSAVGEVVRHVAHALHAPSNHHVIVTCSNKQPVIRTSVLFGAIVSITSWPSRETNGAHALPPAATALLALDSA
jgi:hypothetical protein